MKPNIFIVLFGLTMALILGLSQTVLAQEAPKVLTIAGKAEILKNGRWYRTKAGEELKDQQAIRLVEGREVTLVAREGKITIVISSGSTVKYNGLVPEKNVPWISAPQPTRSKSPVIPEFELVEGQSRVEVTPGQPLRIITPLIMAAVRGTGFAVSVKPDGSSAIRVNEGSVSVMGRTGKTRVIKAGSSYQLTAAEYTDFLKKKGFTVPPEGWRYIPHRDLEALDAKTFRSGAPRRPASSPAVGQPKRRPRRRANQNSSAAPGNIPYGQLPDRRDNKRVAAQVEMAPALEEISPALSLNLRVSVDLKSFIRPSDKGYQSTAKITALFENRPVKGPVTWQVIDIVNPQASWWQREPSAQNGLTWGDTADGTGYWETDDVAGQDPEGSTAYLTDVVGSRTVTILATAVINGYEIEGTAEVKYGPGPLSIFTGQPRTNSRWAQKAGNASVSRQTMFGDFTDSSNSFPAARTCGGTVDNTGIVLGGQPGAWTARFPDRSWRPGDYPGSWYSRSSNLPTSNELLAVARYEPDNYPKVLRKGAALAANWPAPGGEEAYLTGEVSFDPALGLFQATKVTLGHKKPGNLNYNSEIFRSSAEESNFGVVCTG
ncbi:MAG: FecR family protein [Deltaproteobacteria bacterium]|nr:FecR family protein [Deltaproteobacteria bacterium]